jgi:hypothetical protein
MKSAILTLLVALAAASKCLNVGCAVHVPPQRLDLLSLPAVGTVLAVQSEAVDAKVYSPALDAALGSEFLLFAFTVGATP